MGHHGWQGDPPRGENAARTRIIEAATRCLERQGAERTTLSDVALEVGVTRQTVYRYFADLPTLLNAVAESGADDFVQRMEAHLASVSTPVDAVVESIAFCLEEIPHEPRIGALVSLDSLDLFSREATSASAFNLGARILRGIPLDWAAIGIHDEEFEDLAELVMRLMVSFLQYPPTKPRTPDELRQFLQRWLGPALTPHD